MTTSFKEKPLQLIEVRSGADDGTNGSEIFLDHDNLETVLDRTNGNSLCVLCVCGPSRKGKSFLLSYMVRYLEMLENGERDWMCRSDRSRSVVGFPFRNGIHGETLGIQIWSKPFTIITGEEAVSVLLIDTQGTFDEFTNSRIMSSLMGTSLLMSSHLIFNVFKILQDNMLASLESYVSFAKLALHNQISTERPFQKLSLLIRDWNAPSVFPYGGQGGKAFLDNFLGPNPGRSQEAKYLRGNIVNSFCDIDCHLLPHPGEKALLPDFNGSLEQMSAPFADHLKRFIEGIFQPDNLVVKQILSGATITSSEFKSLLDMYVSNFNSEKMPSPKSRLDATIYIVNQNSVERSLKKYLEAVKNKLRQRGSKYLSGKELAEANKAGKLQAMSVFSQYRKYGDLAAINELEDQLDKMIAKELAEFKRANKSKRDEFMSTEVSKIVETFEDDLGEEFAFGSRQPLTYYEEDTIVKKAEALLEDLLSEFQNLINDSDEDRNELLQLEEKLQKILSEKFILENQTRRKKAEREIEKCFGGISEQYDLQLRHGIEQNPGWDIDNLENFSQKLRLDMMEKYIEEKRKFMPKTRTARLTRATSSLNKAKTDSELGAKLDKVFEAACAFFLVRKQEGGHVSPEGMQAVKVNGNHSSSIHFELPIEDEVEPMDVTPPSYSSIDTAPLEHLPVRDFHFSQSQSSQFNMDHINSPYTNKVFGDTNFEDSRVESLARQRQELVEKKLKRVSEESLKLYKKEMGSRTERMGLPSGPLMEKEHERCSTLAMKYFADNFREEESITNEGSSALLTKINLEYCNLKSKILATRNVAESKSLELVDDCFAIYNSAITKSSQAVKSMENFELCHKSALDEAVRALKSKCPVKDEEFTATFISKLMDRIRDVYLEIKETLTMQLQEKETASEIARKGEVILEIVQVYHKEMSKHFNNHLFIRSEELELLHKKASDLCMHQCKQRCALNQDQEKDLKERLSKAFEKYEEENCMNLECEDAAIGIDLGTTFSCVAVYIKGKIHVIPNGTGHKTTPSYVRFEADGTKTVGNAAKEGAYENPECTIFDAKRLIGRKMDNEKVQQDIALWPFTVEGERGVPKINVKGKLHHPEEISAEVLKEMKKIAVDFLRKPVTKAVITVPAYFTDGQRQATIDAGKLAGLEVLEILTEPVAAAIAYKKQHAETFGGGREQRNILIFDLGGGTFDVAVLKSSQGKMDVLEVGGDDHLGGEDFDRELMNYCAAEFKKSSGIDLYEGKDSTVKQTKDDARRRLKRLQGKCEQVKIDLTTARVATISIDSLYKGMDLKMSVSRGKFEEICASKFQYTIDIVEKTLKEAKLQSSEIHDIVLVGGSTRIPKIQGLLQSFFGGKALDRSINPDEAVAWGAAMKAAFKNGSISKDSLDFTEIRDVTPMSIGVEVYGGGFSVIIPKSMKIPVKAIETYRTAHNNQTSVQITIYQGEERVAVKNKHLGDFYLNGIPPNLAGAENIEVEMTINSQGILHVNAIVSSTGGKKGITVKENKQRMSQALIKKMLSDGN